MKIWIIPPFRCWEIKHMHAGRFADNYVKDLNNLNIRRNLKAKLEHTQDVLSIWDKFILQSYHLTLFFQNGNAEQQQNNCKVFDSKKILEHFFQTKQSFLMCKFIQNLHNYLRYQNRVRKSWKSCPQKELINFIFVIITESEN